MEFGWNWPSGPREGRRFIFHYVNNIFQLKQNMPLHRKNHEYSNSKNALFQVLLKLSYWFWRR